MRSLLTVAAAAALIGASAGGAIAFAAVLAVVQVALVVGWFLRAGLNRPGQAAGALVAVAGGIAADVTLLRNGAATDVQLGQLVGVLAAVVGLGFAVQLARRDGRARLTDALAATVATGALVVAGAVLVAVRSGRGGIDVLAVALVAAAVTLVPAQSWVPAVIAVPVGGLLGITAGVAAALPSTVVGHGPAAALAAVAAVAALAARRSSSGPAADHVGQRIGGAVATSAAPLLLIAPGVLVVARIMIG